MREEGWGLMLNCFKSSCLIRESLIAPGPAGRGARA
jgi:hypothetical protein